MFKIQKMYKEGIEGILQPKKWCRLDFSNKPSFSSLDTGYVSVILNDPCKKLSSSPLGYLKKMVATRLRKDAARLGLMSRVSYLHVCSRSVICQSSLPPRLRAKYIELLTVITVLHVKEHFLLVQL